MTFPPRLVTFPRCLIRNTYASHRCIFISLKCLIPGDIAMNKVAKRFVAVEVNAIHHYPIHEERKLNFLLLRTSHNKSRSLASLYCWFSNHFFWLLGFVSFLFNKSHVKFPTTNLDYTPKAILKSLKKTKLVYGGVCK